MKCLEFCFVQCAVVVVLLVAAGMVVPPSALSCVLGEVQQDRQEGVDAKRDDAGSNERRTKRGYFYREGMRPPLLFTPVPISPEELRGWSALLELSEAQRNSVIESYRQYMELERSTYLQHVQPIWEMGGDITRRGGVHRSLENAREFARLFKDERPRAIRILAEIDAAFFVELQEILSEEQNERLHLIRELRSRTKIPYLGMIPGYEFDIVLELLALADREGIGISSLTLEMDKLLNVLRTYSSSMTGLIEQRNRAFEKSSTEGVIAQIGMAHATPVRGEETLQETAKRHRSISEQRFQAEKRVADLTRQYITVIAELLYAEHGHALRDRYRAACYPHLFPDPTEPRHLLEPLLSRKGLTRETRATIAAIHRTALEKHESIQRRMIDAYRERREYISRTRRNSSEAFIAYHEAMLLDHERRVQNLRESVTMAIDVLSAEGYDEMAQQLDGELATLLKDIDSMAFTTDPSTGPMGTMSLEELKRALAPRPVPNQN